MLANQWQNWLARFWWLRGAGAAFAFVGLVTQAFPWERFEFLRFVYALMLSWNSVAEKIAAFLRIDILFPDLGAATVNVLIVVFTVFLPFQVATFYRRQSKSFYIRWVALFVLVVPGWTINTFSIFRAQYQAPALAFLLVVCLWHSNAGDLAAVSKLWAGNFSCLLVLGIASVSLLSASTDSA